MFVNISNDTCFLGSLTCLRYFHLECSISIFPLKRVVGRHIFCAGHELEVRIHYLASGYDNQRRLAEDKAQRASVSGL